MRTKITARRGTGVVEGGALASTSQSSGRQARSEPDAERLKPLRSSLSGRLPSELGDFNCSSCIVFILIDHVDIFSYKVTNREGWWMPILGTTSQPNPIAVSLTARRPKGGWEWFYAISILGIVLLFRVQRTTAADDEK